jgi:hypothetical protein
MNVICLCLDQRALKALHIFQGPGHLPVDALNLTHEPHPRFPAPGHVLSVGGDALIT